MKRPIGVTAFAIVMIVLSSFVLLKALWDLIMALLPFIYGLRAAASIPFSSVLLPMLANAIWPFVTLILAIVAVIIGANLLRMKEKARKGFFIVGIIILVFKFIMLLYGLINAFVYGGGIPTIAFMIMTIVAIFFEMIGIGLFYGFGFWYFTKKDVKKEFIN